MNEQMNTQIVLGNAAQLALSIVRGVLGNGAADSLDGVALTDGVCLSMIEARLAANYKNHVGVDSL